MAQQYIFSDTHGLFIGTYFGPNGTVLEGQFLGKLDGSFIVLRPQSSSRQSLRSPKYLDVRLSAESTSYDVYSHPDATVITTVEKVGFMASIARFNKEELLHRIRNNLKLTEEFLQSLGYNSDEIYTILEFNRTGRVQILREFVVCSQ